MRSLLAALVATLALPLAAHAQPSPVSKDLTFTTISKSSQGGAPASQKVVQDKTAYSALFSGSPPSTPSVDFTKEDVLAVAMGQQNTGGYAIEVKRIELMTGGITGGYAFVHYVETRPAPGTIVTMALTAPRHVVKVGKGAIKYLFVNDSAATTTTDDVSLRFTHPLTGYEFTIGVDDAGKAKLLQSSPTAHYMPLDGQATAAELAALKTAVKGADAATLPKDIPDPRMFIVAPDAIELTFHQAGKTYTLAAHYDYYTSYDARVKPVVSALEAIANRLKGVAPAQPSFDKLYHAYIGGFVLFQQNMTLSKDGAVTVNRTFMHTGGTNKVFTGQATKAELDAVKQAFDKANVTTLPKTINDPTPIMDIPAERLVSTIAGKDYTLDVSKAGRYMTYDARIRPLVDALGAIQERVVTDAEGVPIYGLVSVGANGVKVDKYTVPFGSPLYKTLKYAAGRNVQLQAHVKAGDVLDVIYVQGIAKQDVNVRTASGWWGKVVGTIKKGEAVNVTGESWNGQYYQVDASGVTGWSFRPFITIGDKP